MRSRTVERWVVVEQDLEAGQHRVYAEAVSTGALHLTQPRQMTGLYLSGPEAVRELIRSLEQLVGLRMPDVRWEE